MKNFNSFLTEISQYSSGLDTETYNKIIDYMNNNSYFDLYDEDDKISLLYTTRENGDVGSETYGDEDITEANRIKKILLNDYNNIQISIEGVDEWVHISISEIPEDVYNYTFKKDINGLGFSQTFKDMDSLIDKFYTWVVVDWNEIKEKIEKIDNFPNNMFTGWHDSNRVLIKSVDDEDNDWGYNFYIIKKKKD